MLSCTAAQALQITSLSPQGEVAQIRQVVIKFDEAAVNFGDPRAAAPATLSCSDSQASKGNGRWTSEREWVYELEQDLSAGVRCTVAVNSSFQSPAGRRISSASSYAFNSGGPFVKRIWPYEGQRIDEEQIFVLQLSGAVDPATLNGNLWCNVQGLGERVPFKMVEGGARTEVLKSLGLTKAAERDPQRILALQCNRRLSADARVSLVYGKGISTPNVRGTVVPNTVEKRFDFQVRQPFTASFSCERENAQSACLPIMPMSLRFSSPITRKMAQRIVLKGGSKSIKPSLEDGAADDAIQNLQFKPPLPEETELHIELPSGFTDASGRTLNNADSFPLKTRTAGPPPLAKFAASSFGVIERFAEPGSEKTATLALLPVTLRNVEQSLPVKAVSVGSNPRRQAGEISDLLLKDDASIIEWYRKVQHANNTNRESRETPLLGKGVTTRALELPKPEGADAGKGRPFEVVGVPLSPGFHVVEIASQRLGEALLDEKLGKDRKMYVRTSALVTNLGVHFKLGRENSLAWVTTLDKAKVVAGAEVRVSNCAGKLIASGKTNEQGVATLTGIDPTAPPCPKVGKYDSGDRAYFVSARHTGADGVADMAFTWSDWQKGIEPWRFNMRTSSQSQPDDAAHTILDRSLFRAGETVGMKHLLRTLIGSGFGIKSEQDTPDQMSITHVGSGTVFKQPLLWRKTATGGLTSESSFAIPPAAKLGVYEISLSRKAQQRDARSYNTTQFRVEEFRLPVLEGSIVPTDKKPLVNAATLPTSVQINYVAGGPASNLPVRVSAMVRGKYLSYPDFEAYSFEAPRKRDAQESGEEGEEAVSPRDNKLIADKLPITLDKNGGGKLTLEQLPQAKQPQDIVLEATYADPNGEIQTIRSTQTLWPASVVAGIRTEGWASASQKIKFQALALDLAGKPQSGVKLEVQAIARITTTSRKRMVGGFYSYDNKTEIKDLGKVCDGKSDSRGLLLCDTKLGQAGEIDLIVTATDKDGNSIQAASSVWVTKQGELWFGGEDHDRIDLLPEKKNYQAGETAKLQVRMPFRFATALVTLEREGVLQHRIVQLNGQDPTIELKIDEAWTPNVYVSALVLRGRLREVPWYSFFSWGYKAPREWWNAFWVEGQEYSAPTALVDLSKPAFRLGVAELRVGSKAHALDVKVVADKESYPVRGTAKVTISAKLPDGKPAANAEVALAAVDQALLELSGNETWDLLEAMLQPRAWGVETSTAQMEIIGRRHYGRKAVPAGGGGGKSQTRELLDTLLVWNPKVQLDANGQATVNVPLNDAITSFKIVAVADHGTGRFGTGQTTIKATQDLQIISGLPPLVREGDEFRAQLTLRNTTKAAMKVDVSPRAALLELKSQSIDIPAGESREVAWNVVAPPQLALSRFEAILWEIEAKDSVAGARDALKARQRIVPAVPVTVQQATLVQLDGAYSLDAAWPAGAIEGRGGLKLALQPKLAEGMPGVRDYFAQYPFICLEQKTSKSVGLRDAKLWQTVAAQIPTYLDSDGLANYFPPRQGDANRGSDVLTAYLLSATHEAAGLNAAFTIPDESRAKMEAGLLAFVEGKIQRDFWSPRKDLDMRKIAALEALSRFGRAQGRMVGSITIAPNQWPTHTVIDWLQILQRVRDVPKRDERLAEAQQILRARLSYQGTKLIFSTEKDDYWWWLMQSGDVNTARLILAVMNEPSWKDDMPRLANGFISRQQRGAWLTTTANLWGGIALEKFSAAFEATPVAGSTRAVMGAGNAAVDWARVERITASDTTGAPNQATMFGAPASPGNLRNNSMMLAWGKEAKDTLSVTHQGTGKPWLTIQSLAAVPLTTPFNAGYQVKKTITAVEQATAGKYSRGDVLRVSVEVIASADMTWVAVTDPIPGGATILGGGLGRDSAIATSGERAAGNAWPAFEERSFEAFRAYYEYVPKGSFKFEYTIRLNNVGDFALPPTRAEAMYAPEMFGETPNARVRVEAK
ncbi:MG2 domain-containing protein [Variovorax sp. PCZ-1]|uniref:alpha-2-macroglobulin family protein n=1 Tax=Variovorax sp. PCZ-1 TaxID=2835533 RepID=UPI0020C11F39|nr:MG2 domain-containing protein [Variovorax sp. PCZ-1]